MMISSAFDAAIPILCVTLAGLVVLLAEAFRGRDEKMPIGGLAIIGLIGAGAASILLWNRNTESFGAVSADNFGLFVNIVLVVVGILTVIFSAPTVERDRLPAGEHLFMFVADGNRWITPPLADDFVDDGFGSRNGVVIVR